MTSQDHDGLEALGRLALELRAVARTDISDLVLLDLLAGQVHRGTLSIGDPLKWAAVFRAADPIWHPQECQCTAVVELS